MAWALEQEEEFANARHCVSVVYDMPAVRYQGLEDPGKGMIPCNATRSSLLLPLRSELAECITDGAQLMLYPGLLRRPRSL